MASRGVLPFGLLAREVVPGLLVEARVTAMRWIAAFDRTAAAAMQAMAMGSPGADGIGASPAARACLASLANRSAPAISPTSSAAVNGPTPGLGQQLWRNGGDGL
jgi:hypothetical protein